MSDRIVRVTVYEQVRERLLELIRSDEFSDGLQLPPERELAQRWGVSRSSVREAISSLVMLGLLEARHGVGVYVTGRPSDATLTQLSKTLFNSTVTPLDVMEMRCMIEPAVASWVAQHRSAESLSALQNQAIVDTVGGRLAEQRIHVGFHRHLAAATGNSVMSGVSQLLLSEPTQLAHLMEKDPKLAQKSKEEHEAIVRAIEAQDGESASQVMKAHLDDLYDLLANE